MSMKNNTKIPEKQYIILIKRNNSYMPTGFMTPYGTDKASINRMETLKRNVRGWNTLGNSGLCIIDNSALSGFKLTGKVYNGTGQDNWTIEDPRGFVLEITSENINELVMSTTIEKGEILSPCVWGRRGSNNVLISTYSNEYKIAISNTNAANSKASWRDVKIGDTVLLRNNLRGVWLGKLYPVFHSYYGAYSSPGPISNNEVQVSDKSYHVIYVPDTKNKTLPHCLHIISSPQLSKILDTSNRLERKQAEQMVNDLINDASCGESSNLYRRIISMSYDRDIKFNINSMLVDIANEQEMLTLLEQGSSTPWVFCDSASGLFGKLKLNAPSRYMNKATEKMFVINYSKPHFENNQLRRVLEQSTSKSFNSRGNYWNEIHTTYAFNSVDRFYIISFNIGTVLGNNLNVNVG